MLTAEGGEMPHVCPNYVIVSSVGACLGPLVGGSPTQTLSSLKFVNPFLMNNSDALYVQLFV